MLHCKRFQSQNLEGTGGTGKAPPACLASRSLLQLSHVASVELLSKSSDLRKNVCLFKLHPPLVRMVLYYYIVPWGEVSLWVYRHIRKDVCKISRAKCLSFLLSGCTDKCFPCCLLLPPLPFDKRLVSLCPLTGTIYLTKEKKAVS